MLSAKNATVPGETDGISSGLGLGMGDDLLQQVEQAILQRRQKSQSIINQAPVAYGAQGFGVSLQPGAGGMSPAILGLMGQGGFNG